MATKDWKGRTVDQFVGMRTSRPAGVITGGYIDAVDVILLDVRCDDGEEISNVPLDGQPHGYPMTAEQEEGR
jgi:hypothetical protein